MKKLLSLIGTLFLGLTGLSQTISFTKVDELKETVNQNVQDPYQLEKSALHTPIVFTNNLSNIFEKNYISKLIAQETYEKLLEKTKNERQEKWQKFDFLYQKHSHEKIDELTKAFLARKLTRIPVSSRRQGLTEEYLNDLYIPYILLSNANKLINRSLSEGLEIIIFLDDISNNNVVTLTNKQEIKILKNYFKEIFNQKIQRDKISIYAGKSVQNFKKIMKMNHYIEFEEIFKNKILWWEKNHFDTWQFEEAAWILEWEDELEQISDHYFNHEFMHYWLSKKTLELKTFNIEDDSINVNDLLNKFDKYLNKKIISQENKIWIHNLKEYLLKKTGQENETLLEIDDHIINFDLGIFNAEPTEEEIYHQIEKLNPDLNMTEIEIIAISRGRAIAIVNDDSEFYYSKTLVFTYKVDINLFIPNNFLGVFAKKPTDNDLLERINHLQPDFDLSQIKIKSHTSGQAVIQGKGNSTINNHQIEIILTYKITLIDLIKNTNLGYFDNWPTEEDILARIKELNPDVDLSQLEVYKNKWSVLKHFGKEFSIRAARNSSVYWSENFDLIYEIKGIVHLDWILRNINYDLGEFESYPTEAEVFDRLKQLVPEGVDLSQLKVLDIQDAHDYAYIAIKPISNSTAFWPIDYTPGYAVLHFQFKIINFWNEVFANNYLGQFEQWPTNQDILEQLKQLHPKINFDQIEIINRIENQQVILALKNHHLGNHTNFSWVLFYEIKGIKRLNKDFQNTNLGTFETYPSDQEILNKIKNLNPDVDVTQLEVVESHNNYAVIKVVNNSLIYYSHGLTYYCYYEIKGTKDLSQDLKKIGLGVFDTFPTDQELLARIQELNPDVDVTQLEVVESHNNYAVIKVVNKSLVYSNNVNYSCYYEIKEIKKLQDNLKNTLLGFFDTFPTDQEILNRIKELNPDVDVTKLKVFDSSNDGKIIIKQIFNSAAYKAVKYTFNYEIKGIKTLSSVLKNTKLGMFENIPTKAKVLARIKELNPDVDLSQIEVVKILNSKYVIADQILIRPIVHSSIYNWYDYHLSYVTKTDYFYLDEILVNTDLGVFDTFPTDQEILDRVKEKNPDVDITQLEVFENRNIGKILIKPLFHSSIYRPGNYDFSYQIKGTKDLSNDLKKLDLGDFIKLPSAQEILDRIKELNPDVDLTQVELKKDNNLNLWTSIKGLDNSKIYNSSSLELSYTINNKSSFIPNFKTTKFYYEEAPSIQDALIRIKELNPDVDFSQVQFDKIEYIDEGYLLVLKVINNSKIYFEESIELLIIFDLD